MPFPQASLWIWLSRMQGDKEQHIDNVTEQLRELRRQHIQQKKRSHNGSPQVAWVVQQLRWRGLITRN